MVGGYGILAYDEHYREDDPNSKQHVEPWLITIDLIECIAQFYQNNRSADNVKVIEQPEEVDVNDDDDDDDDDVEAEVVDDEAKYY
jgi:DNA-directed RNA polymerase specialized sigma24 family protein